MAMASVIAFAGVVKIDNLFYELDELAKTASVVQDAAKSSMYNPTAGYKGDIVLTQWGMMVERKLF